MRTLVAIVGYRNLSDFSVGPVLLPELQALEWGPGVDVDDLSYGPIAVVQNLEDRPLYDRMIFLSAVVRDRVPGKVYRRRFDATPRTGEEIQARIEEAVTGVIDLDNLLVIAQHFRVLAPEVVTIEVEPLERESGESFSAEVSAILPGILELVRTEANGGSTSSTVH